MFGVGMGVSFGGLVGRRLEKVNVGVMGSFWVLLLGLYFFGFYASER